MILHNERYSDMSVVSKLLIAFLTILLSCHPQNNPGSEMQSKIDSLQKQLDKTYKPGLGEFMTGIQLHHAKLWFAGQNQNWPLADFEIHEIEESLDDIDEFCKDRPEVKSIGMLRPAIDSVAAAIRRNLNNEPPLPTVQNLQSFKNSFSVLTTTCNNCHKATDHGFNVVTIPTSPPVSNQDFKPAH
jgi:hypothetical protein